MSSRRNTSDASDLRKIFLDPGELVVYAWKNVLIFVWLRDASIELMSKLSPVLGAHLREVAPASVVSIVTNVGELPDEPKRRAYKGIFTAHAANFAYFAMILEREGFLGSAVRGLMTGLLMLTGRQHTLYVTSNAEQAAGWLSPKHAAATGVQCEVEELVRVIKDVRARAMGAL